MVPAEGFEPPTFGLQNRCTTTVLSRRFSKAWRPKPLIVLAFKRRTRGSTQVGARSRSVIQGAGLRIKLAGHKSGRRGCGPGDLIDAAETAG